jgi:periplasmic protein TonB
MGYTALLFCPDDKTVRTVTQVLSELEFSVEACIEPFAAVKKLMSTHFDAVVVDCDNEQNATLLFKSARNSTSNQTSLAVAVVEGQAGVAKAFRIGANLVLTKPINIEQAKGTLRVARGLLRKSEPGKPAAPTATMTAPAPAAPTTPAAPAAPVAAKPAAPKPAPPAKPAATTVVKPAVGGGPLPPRPVQTPTAKPATPAAWPAPAATSSKPKPQEGAVPEIGTKSTPEPSAPKIAVTAAVEKPLPAPAAEIKPAASAHISTSGAASAAAPALEPQESKLPEKSPESSAVSVVETPAEATSASQESAYVGAAPTFSFGASSEPQASGGNKKIIIGVAAALIVAAAGYFGWTQFKGHDAATPTPVPQSAVTAPQPKPTIQPSPVPATPAATTPAPSPTTTAAAPATTPDINTESEEATATPSSPKPAKSAATASSKPSAPAEPEPAPMVVKGGKVPAAHNEAPSADAPAPSMAGMAPGAAPPPDLVTTPTNAATPVLQTLSISQGVSQGLLYKKVSPVYPQNALRMRIEGSVELMATISKNGDITRIKTLSGDPQLSKAATDAVKQWKYKPYLLNGEPVEIQTQITVNFKLPH